jgi:hypothetical protein
VASHPLIERRWRTSLALVSFTRDSVRVFPPGSSDDVSFITEQGRGLRDNAFIGKLEDFKRENGIAVSV